MNERIITSETPEITTPYLKAELSQIILSIFAMDSDPELVSNLKQLLSGRQSKAPNSVYQSFWFKMRNAIRETKLGKNDQKENILKFALDIAREVASDEKELLKLEKYIAAETHFTGINLSYHEGSISEFIQTLETGDIKDETPKKQRLFKWLSSRIHPSTGADNVIPREELDVASTFLDMPVTEIKNQILIERFKSLDQTIFGLLDEYGHEFAHFFVFVQGYELKQNSLLLLANLLHQRKFWAGLSSVEFKERVLDKLELAEAILRAQKQSTGFLEEFRKVFNQKLKIEEAA